MPFYQKCFRFLALICRRQEKITLDMVCKLQVHFVTFPPKPSKLFSCNPLFQVHSSLWDISLKKLSPAGKTDLALLSGHPSFHFCAMTSHGQGGRSLKVLHSQYR